uniref:heparan-alpha-glucosaminide N-acetyltransferase domain-containing protein n=1 Tax=Faecalibacterium sp. TaxID=1971605 RepID=UPI0040258421
MENERRVQQKAPASRYALLDELRGLDLVSMMLYHACWDMMFLFGIWMDWYAGMPGRLWQQSICWVFILLSGFGGLRLALPDAWYANYFTAFFGFLPFDFYSTDYFALLPWLFLFWAGYFLHGVVGRARMEPLRRSVCPALGWMGRHSLLLYLLHQPVIYGVLSAAAVLFA